MSCFTQASYYNSSRVWLKCIKKASSHRNKVKSFHQDLHYWSSRRGTISKNVFMCKRRGKSKNRSMNSNFTTICNTFNIFSGVDDQIRSKQWNTKHARHWSCLLLNSTRLTFKPGQADPQDSINEFIIRKWNPLVVADFRFISAFQCMRNEKWIRTRGSYEISTSSLPLNFM